MTLLISIDNDEDCDSRIFLDDTDVWANCPAKDLWVFDKLIVAKKLGHLCGPRGVDVPQPGKYIVRPCINLMGMGRGAKFVHIDKATDNVLKDGSFWSEVFVGRHLSIDYIDGVQSLCVEGIRSDDDPLWRWHEWRKTEDKVPFPSILNELKARHRFFNVEMINGKIIEIHMRLNPNFKNSSYTSIIPKFTGDTRNYIAGYKYIEDAEYKREGFFVK